MSTERTETGEIDDLLDLSKVQGEISQVLARHGFDAIRYVMDVVRKGNGSGERTEDRYRMTLLPTSFVVSHGTDNPPRPNGWSWHVQAIDEHGNVKADA